MKFISVIPARAGSKGIKNKNIYKVANKPLIEYTFNQVVKSKIKQNFVLTDSQKIKRIAKRFNIISDYIRSPKLSGSRVSLAKTLFDFHLWLNKKKIYYDYMVILQPTSPLRNYKDINNSIKIIKKKNSMSLFSISESLEHPYETIVKQKDNWKFVLNKSKKFHRRQDFDIKTFFINGAIYISNRKLIQIKKTYKYDDHSFYIMPKSRSFEINDKDEANIIDLILKRGKK